MRLLAFKLLIKIVIWLFPLITFIIYTILLSHNNEKDIQTDRQLDKVILMKDKEDDVELPVISICSRNQFSQRDTDKILEMEDWRGINLQYWWQLYYFRNITLTYAEFMSVFHNFAMYNTLLK